MSNSEGSSPLPKSGTDMITADFSQQISYKSLAQELNALLEGKGQVLVGVDGCGGSGKSTFARKLEAVGGDRFVVVEMDDFYKPSTERNEQTAAAISGDFDWERVRSQVLEPLHSGKNGSYQRYDWNHDALAEFHDLPYGTIVIIEGVGSTRDELARFYDMRVWVDCAAKTRLNRGLVRDGEEARSKWVDKWMPAENRYVEAHRPFARATFLVKGDPEQTPPEGHYLASERTGN